MFKKYFIFLFLSLCVSLNLFAATELEINPDKLYELDVVNEIINSDTIENGIVFTIYDYDEDALTWVIPRILHYISLVRNKNKDLPIAIVSHGEEMLSLTNENRQFYYELHSILKDLNDSAGIYFHVCGSFARLNDLDESNFPYYIDVVPSGPEQIRDYESVGYQRVDMEETL
jgi:intracellular sulfur oxidation DsrE/DsrF family protein